MRVRRAERDRLVHRSLDIGHLDDLPCIDAWLRKEGRCEGANGGSIVAVRRLPGHSLMNEGNVCMRAVLCNCRGVG